MTLGETQRIEPLLLDDVERSGIYGIFNNAAGKLYVGSAVNISRRYREHIRRLRAGKHHSPHLQSAWNKSGPGAFIFKALRYVGKEQLVESEQELIDFFQSAWDEAGYNICPTAGSSIGRKLSLESRWKISAKHKGKTLSDDHKAAISAGGKGKKMSEAARLNMSLAQRGYGGGNAVLTEADVIRIREMASSGAPQKEICKIFDVSRGYVSLIVTRRRWGHI